MLSLALELNPFTSKPPRHTLIKRTLAPCGTKGPLFGAMASSWFFSSSCVQFLPACDIFDQFVDGSVQIVHPMNKIAKWPYQAEGGIVTAAQEAQQEVVDTRDHDSDLQRVTFFAHDALNMRPKPCSSN